MGVGFGSELHANATDGIDKQLVFTLSEHGREFRQTGCGQAARFGRFLLDASRVVAQGFFGAVLIAAGDLLLDVVADFGGGHAPRFGGFENGFALLVGDLRPELLGENIDVGFDVQAVTGHFFFVGAKNLAEAVEFRAHFGHHAIHGVHFNVAALEAFHRVTDGNVLGEL